MKILLVFVIFVQSFHQIVNLNTTAEPESNLVTKVPLPKSGASIETKVKWIAARIVRKSADLVTYLLCGQKFKNRMLIKKIYNKTTNSDLYKDLDYSNSWDNFMAQALLTTRAQFAAQELEFAMNGAGTDELGLTYILCSKTNAEMKEIKQEYQKRYSKSLLDTVKSETEDEYQYILSTLIEANRSESEQVDMKKVKEVAFYMDEARNTKHYDKFLRVLLRYSNVQLMEIINEYEKISEVTIEKTIDVHASNHEVKVAYQNYVRFVKDSINFYMRILHDSMVGVGVYKRYVVEVILDRWEIDMKQIKESFKNKTSHDLGSYIQYEFRGSIRETLLLLTNERKYLSKITKDWLKYMS